MKWYFTFGQSHVHTILDRVFDKDIVVSLSAPDERTASFKMSNMFGRVWGMSYSAKPDMRYYPKGIFNLDTWEMEKGETNG